MKNCRTLLPPKLQELMNAARDKVSQLKAGVQQAPGVCQVSVWSRLCRSCSQLVPPCRRSARLWQRPARSS